MITERLKELLLNAPIKFLREKDIKIVRHEKLLIEIEIEIVYYEYIISILLDETGGFEFDMRLKGIKDFVFYQDYDGDTTTRIFDTMLYLREHDSKILKELRKMYIME